eukprot:10601620-Prorocentrum_lima.AAC.1
MEDNLQETGGPSRRYPHTTPHSKEKYTICTQASRSRHTRSRSTKSRSTRGMEASHKKGHRMD